MAFDVYAVAGGWYLSRVFRHVTATVVFIFVTVYLNVMFLVDRGRIFDLMGLIQLLNFLLGYPGFFRLFIPLWCHYLMPGYLPWGHGEAGNKHRVHMTQCIAEWTNEMNILQGGSRGNNNHHCENNESKTE